MASTVGDFREPSERQDVPLPAADPGCHKTTIASPSQIDMIYGVAMDC